MSVWHKLVMSVLAVPALAFGLKAAVELYSGQPYRADPNIAALVPLCWLPILCAIWSSRGSLLARFGAACTGVLLVPIVQTGVIQVLKHSSALIISLDSPWWAWVIIGWLPHVLSAVLGCALCLTIIRLNARRAATIDAPSTSG